MGSVTTWHPCNDGRVAADVLRSLVTVLQQLLLIPLLAPLLAVLLLGAINPRPPVVLRLLVWSSPALPLGAWIAAAAAAGAGLSAAATTLALRQSASAIEPPAAFQRGHGSAGPGEPAAAPKPRTPSVGTGVGPSRAPGEPAPTVEVPYRVIRRPAAEPSAPKAAPTARPEAPVAQSVGDGWDQPLKDDWE
ncbi:MAG: hypothetical protein RLZZ336_1892 [Cyanobacteriota bacterium]|jgi:hypothetical protein